MAPTIKQLRAACASKLDAQLVRAATFQRYFDGEPEIIALLDSEERRTFKKLLRESRANWCELIVNAVAERLHVTGFNFGDVTANDLAWEIWQASQMDADGDLVQTDALVQSSAFVLVQPDESNPTGVAMTGESAMEATVLYEPGSRRRRRAGYKRFTDGGDGTIEVLILPDEILTWYPGDAEDRPERLKNPAGLVNLVEMCPQPRTLGAPRSELTPAIPFQDRINTTIFNRMVSSDYGAFRQIWATGLKMQRRLLTNADGTERTELVKPYNVGADRLLVNENPDGRFGAIPEATQDGYLNGAEQDVQHLAAITQTPPHYLLGKMINIPASGMKAAETGLVAKTGRRSLYIGESWEESMRIALALVGSPAAVNVGAETIWKDFETRSEGELMDALTKAKALGVPDEEIWSRYGATPQQITRWGQLNQQADPYAQLLGG